MVRIAPGLRSPRKPRDNTSSSQAEGMAGTGNRGPCLFPRAEGCPILVPRSLRDRVGTLTSSPTLPRRRGQNPRPVATNATRTGDSPRPDEMIWLVNHVVGAELHLHRDREPPNAFTDLLRLGV